MFHRDMSPHARAAAGLWLVCLLLAGTGHAATTLRAYDGPAAAPTPTVAQSEEACDDGTVGGTLLQGIGDWYGNRFVASCAGERVTRVRFQHLSYGLPGPYHYRLHLVDASCTSLAATEVLQVEPADDLPAWVDVDVSEAGWCVSGEYQILLEPLTCVDPLTGDDCFPALCVDSSSTTDPGSHCAVVSTQGAFERACAAARSSDGRYFDFLLRAEVVCEDPACTTAVQPTGWSVVKSFYKSP
jgi:hypothetical protein